jgi:hypothetical protein
MYGHGHQNVILIYRPFIDKDLMAETLDNKKEQFLDVNSVLELSLIKF